MERCAAQSLAEAAQARPSRKTACRISTGAKTEAELRQAQVSVARHLQAPPYAAKRKGLSFGYPSCLRSQSDRSTVVVGNCTCGPITVVPHRAKAGLFSRSSILFRPHARATPRGLVEPPGTAPGSEPLITGAFIAIVRVAPNRPNIGARPARLKAPPHAHPKSRAPIIFCLKISWG